MSQPRVALVHVAPFPQDESDGAYMLRGRLHRLASLASAIGVDLPVVESTDVLAEPPGTDRIAEALRGAKVVWWLGRITPHREMVPLVAAIRAHLAAIGSDARVIDDPEHVEEAFSLARFYPLLERAGVDQAKTTFVPISDEEAQRTEPELRELITRRAPEVGVRFDGGALFFRTYYGTMKIASGLNGAFSLEDLAESGARLVERLRVGQPIGGLAVRELLDIPVRWTANRRGLVRREMRVFIVDGVPRIWLLAGDHDEYRVSKIPRELMEDVARLSPADLASIRDQAARAGRALGLRFLVADFTVLESGRVVCLEVNPGHACGWCHAATFVAAYGPWLRTLAGLPPMEGAWQAKIASAMGVDMEPEGKLFGLL